MTAVVIEPDAFFVAAQSLDANVVGVAAGAVIELGEALAGCAAMAGSDEGGRDWAGQYDGAARTALAAGADLATASFRVVCLLECTGLNHERAEVASTPGGTMPSRWTHDPAFSVRVAGIPSAAGGSGGGPPGWSLVRHLVGYAWPNGHQNRLRHAASAWDTAADALRRAGDAVDPVRGRLCDQRAPEVADAETVLAAMQRHLGDLAATFAGLARACRALALHIDRAHSEVESALVELVAESAAIETAGAALSLFSFGTAEAPTQVLEGSRISAAAARVAGFLSSFVSAVRTVVAAVPSLAAIARGVSTGVEWLRDTRIVSAEVAGVRGLRILRVESIARDGAGAAHASADVAKTEAAAETGLADAAAGIDLDNGTVDLGIQEREGGHTLARHVGLSEQELIARGIPRASTFASRADAESSVADNLTANQAAIESWLKSGSRRSLRIETRSGPDVGRIYDATLRTMVKPSRVITILRPTGDGFRIQTAYLEG